MEYELHSCDMSYIKDLSQLYFWGTNINQIDFAKQERFSIIENDNSKIIYAIDSAVIWWKHSNRTDIHPFRHSIKEFFWKYITTFLPQAYILKWIISK